jgi:hypothetical protein
VKHGRASALDHVFAKQVGVKPSVDEFPKVGRSGPAIAKRLGN